MNLFLSDWEMDDVMKLLPERDDDLAVVLRELGIEIEPLKAAAQLAKKRYGPPLYHGVRVDGRFITNGDLRVYAPTARLVNE